MEELTKLRQEHDALKKTYADELESGKRRSIQSITDITNLEKKLTKAGADLAASRSREAKLEGDMSRAVNELEADKKDLNHKLDAATRESNELTREVTSLKVELSQLRVEMKEQLKEQRGEFEFQIEDQQSKIADYKETTQDL